ncbi:carbohydrate binding family 9 domain-containing protein [Prolixibacteraceae bacterium Z1-6]|uniref:Carbohydrate binding family 9 domain-containing protein n=1 Tax=Draconibacterium aestuarii TaxID=2998507 RepID=A0A9X3F1X9_9BACT|nr:carbohydrate binding family 9 domain-containing protein [Prolixibacteraceae bacterium Z1-6]
MKPTVYLFLVFSVLLKFSTAQTKIQAVRVETPPTIDGIVNDEIWNHAFMVNEFFQREPNEGEQITERTEFYTCYDDNNIYFAAKCWSNPEDVIAKELARDVSLGKDDRIQIIMDTYHDKRNGYWFQIGPRGSIGDAIISENGAVFNKQWDGLWNGKARITEYGWEAELVIPFKTLGFDKESNEWGIKFIRHMVNKLESGYWPVANLNTHKFQVSDGGTLTGIENITQGIGLDIAPYLLTGMDTKKGNNNDGKLTGGIDMFYQITPSLKSSLSINTDFAETEVDDRQINLTRFSLHYPEKRDFFLNGANYFQFGIEGDSNSPVAKKIIPFFSRRMGLDENGNPIRINVGAKLTGQIEDWNVGMMYINDDRDLGNNNFSVARVTRNLGTQSSIGIIGTYGNSFGDSKNLVTGADVKLSTSTFQGNKNVSLFMFGLKSTTTDVESNDASWGAQVVYPNDLINARLGYHQIGKNFIAGMGFVPRTNIRENYGELEIGPRPNKWGIMQIQFGGEFDFVHNLETNELETREIKLKPLGIRFLSGEEISYSLTNQYEMLSEDFNIYSNYIIPEDKYEWWFHEIAVETKGARNIYGEASYGFGNFYTGYRKDIDIEANWKVAVPLFLGGKFHQSQVELPEGDFTANIYQAYANILFSPTLTLYNYFQYDNASNNIGWQSRFRWILKPGNEVILAWTSNFLEEENKYLMDESSLRLKLKYNIRF